MIKYLFSLVMLFNLQYCFGQNFNIKYGQPVIVLIEEDPWLMVIGSDVPSFTLYENGQIIYKKMKNKTWTYFEVQNDKEKTQQLIKTFGITDSLMKQQDFINASNSTDQPNTILILNFDTLRELSVYGKIKDLKSAARLKTPKDFLTVYDHLIKFDDLNAKEWLPEQFEVLATKYNHSPEKPLPWKNEWGDLKSSTTVKRNDNLYSIYLDKKYFPDFVSFLKNIKEKQAVEINGEKYSLSYRLPFPNLK